MDRKLNYPRFRLWKKQHEKTPSRREITFFPKVCKTAVFGKIAKGGPRENFQKMADFLGKLRKAKKKEIQVAQHPDWYGWKAKLS